MSTWSERLNATVLGSGSRWVVLGHGFGADQGSWRQQEQALLGQGLRVLRFDLAGATPGTQQAFHHDRHASLFGFAEDLLMLLQELDVRQAAYVGHSLGAMVGMLAANGQPGLFDRIVSIGASARYIDDPAGGYVGGLSQGQADVLLGELATNYTAWANGFARSMIGDQASGVAASDFAATLLGLRPDIALTVLRAALLADHRDDVRALRVPLYVIAASDDPAVPADASRWLAEHGHARRLMTVQVHGHLPHLTAPQAVTQALLECLRDAGDA